MKVIVIGIDGAHAEAFRRGWTPFLEGLLDRADVAPIREDLVGRGWSKIVLGIDASVTGATYDRPDLDGTHGWSLRFTLADVPGIGDTVRPLWEILSRRGWRVGVMNVPTAFPAPAVDGFFVSGGGGGGPVLQDPTPDLCHPRDIHPDLLSLGYIVDERLGSMLAEKRIYDAASFFERMALKNQRRVDAFLALSAEFAPDFGFVVFKSSANMAEFLYLPEEAAAGRDRHADGALARAVKSYYAAFDAQVRRLHDAFRDAEIVLVSDHGMAARRWSFNPNAMLRDLGLQSASRRRRGVHDAIRIAKTLLPFGLRVRLRNAAAVKKAYESLVTFDVAQSRAFASVIGDWRHGIWVNDSARFGGPVEPGKVDAVKAQIVEQVNAHPEAREHGATATPRPNPDGSPHYPDVVLTVPDGYVSSSDADRAFAPFDMPPGPHDIATVTKGRLLCGKSSAALAAVVGGDGWAVEADQPDLTRVHHHVLSRFPG